MTDHPITPPPELRDKWDNLPISTQEIFVVAAQWGADQELEACIGWLDRIGYFDSAYDLGAARRRRPKPPSLKEQALAKTTAILNDPNRALLVEVRETLELNLLALEALDD